MELCVLYIYKLKTPALHGDGANFEHHELHEQKSAEGSPCTPPQLPVMMGKQLFVHPFYFFYSVRFTMRIKTIPSIPIMLARLMAHFSFHMKNFSHDTWPSGSL